MAEAAKGWSPKQMARFAGAAYLLIIVLGVWAEGFVRGSIFVPGEPAATAANLIAHEGLYRMGIVAETVMALADVTVAVLLYLILRVVSKPLALAALAFHLIETAMLGSNLLNGYAALAVLAANTGTALANAPFDAVQAQMLADFFLTLHRNGYSLALIPFGINCILLGVLIWRAGFLPKLLGVGMAAAGLVYLVTGEVRFAAPEIYGTLTPAFFVCLIAELALALWLLIRGVNEERWG